MKRVKEFLGEGAWCPACGCRHRVGVEHVLYGEEAIEHLTDLVKTRFPDAGVALVADTRTWQAAGASLRDCLAARAVSAQPLILPDPGPGLNPLCDRPSFLYLRERLPDVACLLAVGSGVVNDLAKWVAFEANLPYAVVATAVSMNGYASANVATLVDGVKGLLGAREPFAIAATPHILAQSPERMTAAGLGDVVAKTVSSADWRLNHLIFNEFFCPLCVGLVADIESLYLEHPETIRERTPAGLEALFEALVLTGFSMTMAGTSAPASGGEHLISHALDMMANRDGIEHDLHGRQVGLGTIFCAALIERLRDAPLRDMPLQVPEFDTTFWGSLEAAVAPHRDAKTARMHEAQARLQANPALWTEIREQVLNTVMPAQTLKDVLRRGGAAHRLVDIDVSRKRFLEAVIHGGEIRERFTILDLARCLGILEEAADDIVSEWLM